MHCRYCGAKLGLMERWRYVDFCSKEHKEEFSTETQRLAEERLKSMRRVPSENQSLPQPDEELIPEEPLEAGRVVAVVSVADVGSSDRSGPSEEAATLETAPVMQAFVAHPLDRPVAPPPAVPPPEAAPRPPRKEKNWKYLARVAEFEALPVAVSTGSSRNFTRLEVETVWEDENFLLGGRRLVLVPDPFQTRSWQGKIPEATLQPRESYAGQAWASAPEPITIPRHTWIDDAGRRWIYSLPSERAGEYPGIARVLEHYPIEAPWNDWPEEVFGRGSWTPSASRALHSALGTLPAGSPQAPQGPSPGPNPQVTAGRQPSGTGSPLAPPVDSLSPIPLVNTKPLGGPAPRSSSAENPSTGRSGGFASASGPTQVRNKGTVESVDGPSPGPGQSAGSGQSGPHLARAGASKASVNRPPAASKWQPIVPPVFRALIDIAHDMMPEVLEPVIYALPCFPIGVRATGQAEYPATTFSLDTPLQPYALGMARLKAGKGVTQSRASLLFEGTVLSTTSWDLRLPRLALRPEKPGLPLLPRYTSIRLPMLDRWNPQQSEPSLFLGSMARY